MTPTTLSPARSERTLADKGWVPLRYWIVWWTLLGMAVIVFYVILTPIWLGLRAAAWLAELKARAQRR
jgi:ABC-type multidrug transport system permease subunit